MQKNRPYSHNQLSLFQKARDLPKHHVRVAAFTGEPYVLRCLVFLFALCIAGYLYFVGLSILNLIQSREATADSASIQSTVGALEQEYFTLSKAVTPEMGARLGLSAAKKQAYVRRGTNMATNVRASDL